VYENTRRPTGLTPLPMSEAYPNLRGCGAGKCASVCTPVDESAGLPSAPAPLPGVVSSLINWPLPRLTKPTSPQLIGVLTSSPSVIFAKVVMYKAMALIYELLVNANMNRKH